MVARVRGWVGGWSVVEEVGEGDPKVQISSYKFQACNVKKIFFLFFLFLLFRATLVAYGSSQVVVE